jgi:hypothetical protein
MYAIVSILWAAWIAIAILNTVTARRYAQGLPFPEVPKETPRAAVIVAVRNASNLTRAFFARLRSQAYPDYRIIAAVESEDDPAFAMIKEELKWPGAPLHLAVAGQSERAGQKVWNLLAALEAIEESDEIVAFIDADTLPASGWLSQLVCSLLYPGRDAVTGYRWMFPGDNRLSSAIVAAANTSIVTLTRLPSVKNHCWGGMMAMRREVLDRINIRRYWAGALSDDAQMTRAFKDAAIPVFSPRQSLLFSPVAMSWEEALAFGQRQYRIIWLHDPGLWALAALGTGVPAAGAASALGMALQGSMAAIVLLAVSFLLGEVRYRSRRKIAGALWGEAALSGFAQYWRAERWLRPLWLSFHALCVFSAPGSRHIRWAGIDYKVRGLQDVIVTKRRPAGSPAKERN